MKKFTLMLFALLSLMLTGCSWFDSDPINPKIIGVGNLQYDAKSEEAYVVIDSLSYVVTRIIIPDHNPHSYSTTQDIEPVEGMLVTLFTYNRRPYVQAVAGEQSVEQIEKLYHSDCAGGIMIIMIMMILSVLVVIMGKSYKPIKVMRVYADADED